MNAIFDFKVGDKVIITAENGTDGWNRTMINFADKCVGTIVSIGRGIPPIKVDTGNPELEHDGRRGWNYYPKQLKHFYTIPDDLFEI